MSIIYHAIITAVMAGLLSPLPVHADVVTAALTREAQAAITPAQALELLKQGNSRFINNKPLQRNFRDQVKQTSSGQYPYAAIVSCLDSRNPEVIIFDPGIGDLFVARVAGNFVNDDILGSLEFVTKLAGAKLILVLGHTECGAVKGAADEAQLGLLTGTLANINPAVRAVQGDYAPPTIILDIQILKSKYSRSD